MQHAYESLQGIQALPMATNEKRTEDASFVTSEMIYV
jgi:hypothetical protein